MDARLPRQTSLADGFWNTRPYDYEGVGVGGLVDGDGSRVGVGGWGGGGGGGCGGGVGGGDMLQYWLIPGIWNDSARICTRTAMEIMLFWWNFHHWLHRELWFSQRTVQPISVDKITKFPFQLCYVPVGLLDSPSVMMIARFWKLLLSPPVVTKTSLRANSSAAAVFVVPCSYWMF